LLHWKIFFALLLTIVGGATSIYALTTPFARAKLLIGVGAGLYMILLGIYTLWLGYLITPTCFRGTVPSSKKKVWVQSKMELPAASYHLTLLNPKDGRPLQCTKTWNIGNWIHEDGVVSGSAFCADMAAFIKSDDFRSNIRKE
jgi:hypothetical protein